MLSLPIFILSHENWVYIVGISKKNHQISLVFAKNLWSWTLDPIPYENTSQKFQLWTPGHISGSRMNFWPDSILGGSLACREPRKTHIFMAQGSPLAGQFTIRGLIHKKYSHNSKCHFLWSYGPIPFLPQTSKIWVFWGITCEPRIQNGCFLVEITLF